MQILKLQICQVIGFMTIWGVNLDATSMITTAMSVGFSVDFAAHITYGYMANIHSSVQNPSVDKCVFN